MLGFFVGRTDTRHNYVILPLTRAPKMVMMNVVGKGTDDDEAFV